MGFEYIFNLCFKYFSFEEELSEILQIYIGLLVLFLMKLELSWQIFKKVSSVQFHENPSIESRVVTKLAVAFPSFANAPTNRIGSSQREICSRLCHFCSSAASLAISRIVSECWSAVSYRLLLENECLLSLGIWEEMRAIYLIVTFIAILQFSNNSKPIRNCGYHLL
jgi:hypothetical protein